MATTFMGDFGVAQFTPGGALDDDTVPFEGILVLAAFFVLFGASTTFRGQHEPAPQFTATLDYLLSAPPLQHYLLLVMLLRLLYLYRQKRNNELYVNWVNKVIENWESEWTEMKRTLETPEMLRWIMKAQDAIDRAEEARRNAETELSTATTVITTLEEGRSPPVGHKLPANVEILLNKMITARSKADSAEESFIAAQENALVEKSKLHDITLKVTMKAVDIPELQKGDVFDDSKFFEFKAWIISLKLYCQQAGLSEGSEYLKIQERIMKLEEICALWREKQLADAGVSQAIYNVDQTSVELSKSKTDLQIAENDVNAETAKVRERIGTYETALTHAQDDLRSLTNDKGAKVATVNNIREAIPTSDNLLAYKLKNPRWNGFMFLLGFVLSLEIIRLVNSSFLVDDLLHSDGNSSVSVCHVCMEFGVISLLFQFIRWFTCFLVVVLDSLQSRFQKFAFPGYDRVMVGGTRVETSEDGEILRLEKDILHGSRNHLQMWANATVHFYSFSNFRERALSDQEFELFEGSIGKTVEDQRKILLDNFNGEREKLESLNFERNEFFVSRIVYLYLKHMFVLVAMAWITVAAILLSTCETTARLDDCAAFSPSISGPSWLINGYAIYDVSLLSITYFFIRHILHRPFVWPWKIRNEPNWPKIDINNYKSPRFWLRVIMFFFFCASLGFVTLLTQVNLIDVFTRDDPYASPIPTEPYPFRIPLYLIYAIYASSHFVGLHVLFCFVVYCYATDCFGTSYARTARVENIKTFREAEPDEHTPIFSPHRRYENIPEVPNNLL